MLILLSSLVLFSCGSDSSESVPPANTDTGTGGTDNTTTNNLAAVQTDYQAIFLPVSSSSSDVMNVGGQTITLESGSGYIYRYVPEVPALERLENTYNATNNYSCEGAGAQKPYTTGQLLFNIEVCPNYNYGYSIIDAEQIDSSTGEQIGITCNLYLSGTSQVSITFFVIGNTMYYRDSSHNLKQRAVGCGPASTLLAVGDVNNTGYLYGINGQMISVKEDYTNNEYTIRQHNLSDGVISANLVTFSAGSSNDEYRFYEGDDALYWTIYNRNSMALSFYRFDVTGSPTQILNTTLTDSMIGCAVDASAGKVLISYKYVASRTTSGYATSWNTVTRTYDVSSASMTTLDVGNNFNSTLQYLIYQ
jgi:hypothetical protein